MRKLRDLLVINQKPVTAPRARVLDCAFVRIASKKQKARLHDRKIGSGPLNFKLAVYMDNILPRVGQNVG